MVIHTPPLALYASWKAAGGTTLLLELHRFSMHVVARRQREEGQEVEGEIRGNRTLAVYSVHTVFVLVS